MILGQCRVSQAIDLRFRRQVAVVQSVGSMGHGGFFFFWGGVIDLAEGLLYIKKN
jgi:hypothetical protein